MGADAAGNRPPSPPHSEAGEYGIQQDRIDIKPELYTPPRSIRPTSREPAFEPYEEYASYPPPPSMPVYYSPQPTFVRQVNSRSVPVNISTPMSARSGRAITTSGGSSRNQGPRPSPARRNRNAKPGKRGAPVLAAPLSELTKDYDIPVRDMGAWVNRPREIRMQEVVNKKGYVSRPMNSFMLYRSAYAERVKRFCQENNHQVVSQATGASWPLEPKEVRELYEQYAIIERDNHAAANPNYKFAPNKSGKKRGHVDDDSDSDGEWEGSRSTKRSRRGGREDTRSLSGTPFEPEERYPLYRQVPQPHPLSYQAISLHDHHQTYPFNPPGPEQVYYQQQHTSYAPHADRLEFDGGYPDFTIGSSLIGMPNAGHQELLREPIDHVLHEMPSEQMVDPRLAGADPNYTYEQYGGADQVYSVPRTFEYSAYPQPPPAYGAEAIHPGLATFTEQPVTWSDALQPGSDFDRELHGF